MAALGAAACGPRDADHRDVYGQPDRLLTAAPPKAGAALPTSAPPSDPYAALKRMVAVYRSVASAHIYSSAEVSWAFGREQKSHQDTVLEYVREPARIGLYVRDTRMGTQVLQANGSAMVHWEGVSNTYRRKDVTGSMKDLCQAVDKEAVQLMSPLVFSQSDGLPPGVASARLAPDETIDGKRVQVVEGTLSDKFLTEYPQTMLGPSAKLSLKPTKGRFTLWLDADTGIALKSATDLAWSGSVRNRDGAIIAKDPRLSAVERVVRFVPNPKLADDRFRFIAPKGATESVVERKSDVQ